MKKGSIHIIREEKCSIGNITLRSDKVLMSKVFDGVTTCNLEDLKQQYKIFMEITKGTPHLFYSDVGKLKSLGYKEKSYMNKKFHHFASACAVKENSALTRFIVHSSLYIYKPKIPIKMFKTEVEAINWLKSRNNET